MDREMNTHHQWCSKFGDITEGVCMLCERLNHQYAPLGHAGLLREIIHYFPDAVVIPQPTHKKGEQ
jgi:hypothetical protein